MKQTLRFALTLGLLTWTTLFGQVPSYVPTNGLVGYWPFNGNANDESGNGNNGTVNGATLTTDRFGNSNSAQRGMIYRYWSKSVQFTYLYTTGTTPM